MVVIEFLKNLEPANSMLYLGVFGMLCYVVLVISMIAGADFEGLDEVDADMDGNFLNLSLGGLFSFLMGWGFLGNTLIEQFKASDTTGIVVGTLGGAALALLHSFLRTLIKKAEHKVEIPTVEEGEIGTCYLKIAPGKKGVVTLRGRQVDAVSDEPIESHETIQVVKQARLDEIIKVSKV